MFAKVGALFTSRNNQKNKKLKMFLLRLMCIYGVSLVFNCIQSVEKPENFDVVEFTFSIITTINGLFRILFGS